jgi:hypothetical protein
MPRSASAPPAHRRRRPLCTELPGARAPPGRRRPGRTPAAPSPRAACRSPSTPPSGTALDRVPGNRTASSQNAFERRSSGARSGRRASSAGEVPASQPRSCLGALVRPSARCWDGRIRAAADTRRGRDVRCSFDKRASSPAGSSRPPRTITRGLCQSDRDEASRSARQHGSTGRSCCGSLRNEAPSIAATLFETLHGAG